MLSIDDVLIESWVNLTHHCLCQVQIDHIIVFTHGFCLTQIKLFTKITKFRTRTFNLVWKLKLAKLRSRNPQFGLEDEGRKNTSLL
jgi:hypothetical protein